MGRTGRSLSALRDAKRLLPVARGAGDQRAQAELLNQLAWFSLQLGLPEEGRTAAAAAKRLWKECDDASGEATSASILSWLLVEIGLVDEGFAEATRAVQLAELQALPEVIAFARNAKAITYLYCRQDHLALPLLESALATIDGVAAPSLRALFLTNIGYSQTSRAETAESQGDAEGGKTWRHLAVASNDSAIAMAEACGDLWDLRTALCNGAEYHACLGDPAAAETYLERWLALPGDVGLREKIHYLYTRGEVLTKAGRLSEALEACLEAIGIAERHSHADHRANSNRRLSEVYEAMGLHAMALEYHKRFHIAFQAQMGEVTRRRAQHVESELETVRLRSEAERYRTEAEHDVLTGLPNRRGFEVAVAALRGTPFAVAIVDLDHFKAVNDTFSHVVGDAVLRRAALLLRGEAGVAAFRLGGEEFALLFREQTPAAAAALADRLRIAIAEFDWDSEAPGLSLTASIGVAASGEEPMPGLVALADRRLYLAKAGGRDGVVWSGGEAPGPALPDAASAVGVRAFRAR